MRTSTAITPYLLAFLLSFAGAAYSADSSNMNLVPNGYVHLEFPQLPDTFYTMKTGKKVPAQLEAHLPSNYSKDGKFPLFVFLNGGDGGDADHNSTGGSPLTIGDTDYICVNLPLFKSSANTSGSAAAQIPKDALPGIPPALLAMASTMAGGGIISQPDYNVISSSYATMLGKLYETIPNIDPDRSVMAGFSNGAHTIGVLLAGKDPYTLQHFHSFCMIEGGMGMMFSPKATLTPELKNHRYLFLVGDGAGAGDQKGWGAGMRPIILQIEKNFVQQATAYGLDCSLVIMQNTEHSYNPAYRPVVGQWARGGSAESASVPSPAPAPAPNAGGAQ